MNKQWQHYCEKYLTLTAREQYLILLTGLVAVYFIIYHAFIDATALQNTQLAKQIATMESDNRNLALSINEYQIALQKDPNKATRDQIAQLEQQMAVVDEKLLTLTSELIDPIQMRFALMELLKVEPKVSLMSFELIGAQPLLAQQDLVPESNTSVASGQQPSSQLPTIDAEAAGLNLYKHGIKIKLSGSYFDLRDYLLQLEKLKWKFFWKDFNFTLTEYPMNELTIEIYSLGTKEDFVGV
ncbi:hypothetical protein [Litorilituus sediminis]|uniref:MSHA biogenesis protein MshJ n=1 Tax=Litorilituus sediminis TaxID=718192 RepID=A0A4P6PAE9_9GAMM|nr:hypothetical protein [Litorilituus sediminis]QBG36595.1 hypothetical protein EMK97_13135 [Litorilituus sediminis]